MRNPTDMTSGKPGRIIFSFMMPLLTANIMQQMYVMTDTVIVARGVGVEALAAIGTTDMLRSFVLWGVTGLSEGFGVVIAILEGGGKREEVKESIRAAYWLTFLVGIVAAAAGIPAVKPLLRLIHVPEHIFRESEVYLIIMYAGTFATMLYSTGAAVLRAFGDSKTPFWGMLLSSLVNIILDLLFVFVFPWGIAGAGAATIIAQLLSGFYCFREVNKRLTQKMKWKLTRGDLAWCRELLQKGLPSAFQNSFIAVGGVIFQSVINSYGIYYVAGFTAVSKLYLILEGAALALKGALMSFVGQNMGAGKYHRISEGIKMSLLMSGILSAVSGVLLIFFGRQILMLFISADPGTEKMVLDIAYNFLFNMCVMMFTLYLLDVGRGTVMGLGNTMAPMFSGVAELLGRLLTGLSLTVFLGEQALYLAEPMAWVCGDLIVIPAIYYILHKRRKSVTK